jgi:hypothetical protein
MTTSYQKKVLRIRNSDLIAYYPMNELAVLDLSGNGFNGTPSGVVQAGHTPDGQPAFYLDGSASYIDLISALASAPTTIGTAAIWFGTTQASRYMEGTTLGRLLSIAVDTNNVILMEKTATANTFRCAYIAGGTTKSDSPVIYNPPHDGICWHHLAVTWDKSTGDALYSYVDGTVVTSAGTSSLGTWSGTVASDKFVMGSASTTASNVWKGYMAHLGLWSAVLTADEIYQLAKIGL